MKGLELLAFSLLTFDNLRNVSQVPHHFVIIYKALFIANRT